MRQGVVQRDRYSLIWLVLFVYFVPVVILSFLSAKFLPFSYGRNLFSAGILFAVAGSITLYYLLAKAAVQKIAVPVQEVAQEPVEEEPEV
ncbi:MAG: hypothetical protein KDK48_04625, partial [Chlamydiia bacterium]|nr:hypothetical protein [Chlamydiia bacterium]